MEKCEIMPSSVKFRKESKAWQEKFDALAPRAGDLAPDFELSDVNGENSVRLSEFRGQKPVALVFGSHT